MIRFGRPLIWIALIASAMVALFEASTSPLLEWRDPVYIAAGLSGVMALILLMVQPLLVGRDLAKPRPLERKRIHALFGGLLVLALLLHVAGLWITSPPDMIDALLLRSPTPFSLWGVIGFWVILGVALLGASRKALKLRFKTWRMLHGSLALIAIISSIAHALLIEGTMGDISKVILCLFVLGATLRTLLTLKIWR